ncbi:syntaxin-16 [Anaeramoeba flamelloides]|uniref:Syntaxin-16 n=1 Tax=Anaeramoeba flamelloides TaxID=1746091 RepID=A0AAV8AC01_9EUKA|nr:syntaxin-16 [Anaeramoeba flamelloides]KAJ6228065.1 syntaxin-16 [Anaeramoeba flamelloides]
MTTRNLTDKFLKFRNAVHTYQNVQSVLSLDNKKQKNTGTGIFSDDDIEEQDLLENDNFSTQNTHNTVLSIPIPPKYMDLIEEINYQISDIEKQMNYLEELHNKHLSIDFGDSIEQEHTIQILTSKISKMFFSCEKQIKKFGVNLQENSSGLDSNETVQRNIQISLAKKLRDLSNNFRQKQNIYLQEMKKREERLKEFGNDDDELKKFTLEDSTTDEDEFLYQDKGFTENQKSRVKLKKRMIEDRTQEIQNIVQSISGLAEIMKDLSVLVIEQGTLIDRIDYNIEQVVEHTQEALEEHRKANKYQKAFRMNLCILFLFVVVTILVIVIIFKKK